MASLTYRSSTLTPIARLCATWRVLALLLVAMALVAGCGGDDEERADTAPVTTEEAPSDTIDATLDPNDPAVTIESESDEVTPVQPENEPGGAGDEQPARSPAQLTGRGGKITPRVVRVPAFISVLVSLTSADGARYVLRFGDRTLAAGGELSSVQSRFPGLRPGRALVGEPVDGAGTRVRIEATAEPGP